MATEIAESDADAAQEAGLTPLSIEKVVVVNQVVESVNRDPLLASAFARGVNENTICWQDAEAGVWSGCAAGRTA